MTGIIPWFPLNFEVASGTFAGRARWEGPGFQIIDSTGKASACLLAKAELIEQWSTLLCNEPLDEIDLKGERVSVLWSDRRALAPVCQLNQPRTRDEAALFSLSLKRTRQVDSTTPLGSGIFSERLALLLPVSSGPKATMTDAQVLGAYLSGGLVVSCFATDRIAALSLYLRPSDIEEVVALSGIARDLTHAPALPRNLGQGEWRLPGRVELERFFRENVIEVTKRPEAFAAMGLSFPGSFVLHGPPGTGKTFAVQALADHLRWPVFTADASSLGSPYIHETSRKIADLFRQATENAPSIVIVDELESFLAERSSRGQHALEEVAEFLRIIPTLPERRVLLAAMTNRLDLIDSAVLRRGRVDHIIFVGMPDQAEVLAILRNLFERLPVDSTVQLESVAGQLVGQPVSDAAFLARESGRVAALAGRSVITQPDIEAALQTARNTESAAARRIGF